MYGLGNKEKVGIPLIKKNSDKTKSTSSAKKTSATRAATKRPKPESSTTATKVKRVKLATHVAALRKQVITALEDLKSKDIIEIDVRDKASFADLIIIASGTSTRHVKSIADEVVRFAKRGGIMPLGVEGQKEAEWVLVDLADIVVHVMLPRVREFYGLERLWTIGDDAVSAMLDDRT
jgi:ribosome-associated protein